MTYKVCVDGIERDANAEEIAQIEADKIAAETRIPTLLAKQARKERDQKLSQSDWTQLADSPANAAAWATYRQALRDVPSQADFPNTITWPTEPE